MASNVSPSTCPCSWMWEIGKRAPVFGALGMGCPDNHEPPKSSPTLLSIFIIWEETELFLVTYLLSFLELRDWEGGTGI